MSPTRQRQRRQPPSHNVDRVADTDPVVDQIVELATLWPRLIDALERDRGGEGSVELAATVALKRSDPAPVLVNVDVQRARALIDDGCSRTAAEAGRLLNLTPRRWTTAAVLHSLRDWYPQLRDRRQPLADHIAADVAAWLGSARRALHLSARRRGLGQLCPHHRSERPTELLVEADEAQLHPAIAAGQRQPPGSTPLTWRRGQAIQCPHCRTSWEGVTQLRVLARLLGAPIR